MVARNFPTLKRIAETISARFGCPWQDLGQVVRAFSDEELESALAGVLPGDIAERLQFAGIKCEKIQEKEKKTGTGSRKEDKTGNKTAEKKTTQKATAGNKTKKTTGGNLARILSADSDRLDNGPVNGERDLSETINAGRDPLSVYPGADQGGTCTGSVEDLERVTGDVMPAGIRGQGLPADFADKIEGWLQDFSRRYDLDLVKASQQQWHSACMYAGERVKASGALRDHERIKKHGGNAYSKNALADFIDLWEYFTGLYKHIPMAGDFIALSGVSREWFYDSQGNGLTSSQIDVKQKVRAIEEAGIAGGLVDGRENPTGKIFYSKARLGWQESPQVLQISPASAPVGGALPVFNSAVGALEDKKP